MENEKVIMKNSIKIEITENVYDSDGILTDIREAKAKLEHSEEAERPAYMDEDSLTVKLGCGCHKFGVDANSSSTPIK
jgi:hypothetical protein